MWHDLREKYILYGAGLEGERFMFRHMELTDRIVFCIDGYRQGDFHGIPIKRIEEVDNLFEYKILVAALPETYIKLKSILETYGLKEFEHFNWIRYVEKKVVIISANCHGEALINYLNMSKEFKKRYEIYPIPAIHLNTSKTINSKLLENADVFIHQDIRSENKFSYELSDEYLLPQLSSDCIKITIPNLVGMGHWMFPQHGDCGKVVKLANGNWPLLVENTVLEEAYKDGGVVTLEEYRNFYTSFRYSKEYLDELKDKDMKKLRKREQNWSIQLSDYIEQNCHNIACFVDRDHPSAIVAKEIGRRVLDLLKLPRFHDEEYDFILGLPMPMLPSVAEYFNLRYEENEVRDYYNCADEDMLDTYIKAYIWLYHDIKL